MAIAVLAGDRSPTRTRFETVRASRTPMALSVIVLHELIYGAANNPRQRDNEEKVALFIRTGGMAILPFEEDDATEAAEIRAHLRRRGTPIGPYDVLIAAQARRAGAALVTANRREFDRVPGLIVTDWAA